MKGRIACSADRLSLLEASMISSVVEPTRFKSESSISRNAACK
jgi:hypothetical protein